MITENQEPVRNKSPALCRIDRDLRGFEPSLHEFKEVARELQTLGTGAGLGVVGHGDLESHLYERSHCISRQMLQDIFDKISAEEEILRDVIGPEGSILRYPRRRVRRLETLFGTVWVNRLGYRDRGTGSVFPLDAKLNLPPTRYSHGLQELAAWAVAQTSYDIAMEHIAKHTGAHIHRRQIQEIVQDYARDVDSYYAEQLIAVSPKDEPNKSLLIVSLDGKGIVMRHEDLREETKRRAEGTNHRYQKRLSRGEKRNRKRNAVVAVVYDVAPYCRSAEDIILTDHRSADAPRPSNKRVWASVEKESVAWTT